jgi:DNA-binding NarL/FixJ family response regulator
MSLTLVIVDDHQNFRSSARAMLESQGFDVVGEAADGDEALVAVEALRPDIVLLDIQLPGRDGFAVADELAALPAPPVVVLISSRDPEVYARRVAGAAARGFLSKSTLSGRALAALVE